MLDAKPATRSITISYHIGPRDGGYHGIATRTVTLDWVCPQCGGPRGEPRGENFHCDGEWLHREMWLNPCGHVDYYDTVNREARAREADHA